MQLQIFHFVAIGSEPLLAINLEYFPGINIAIVTEKTAYSLSLN